MTNRVEPSNPMDSGAWLYLFGKRFDVAAGRTACRMGDGARSASKTAENQAKRVEMMLRALAFPVYTRH